MLNGKIVVVTGGAGLLGRAFVHKVAEQGGTVIVADKDRAAAAAVAEQCVAAHPGRAEAGELDITEQVSVSRLIDAVRTRHGRIDAVVNSAYPRNRNYGRKLEDVTYRDFCENVDMHLGGYFLVMQQFGLFFRGQGHGNIVSLASIYGIATPRFEIYDQTKMTMPVEYAAIKSAVVHLTRYFAQYFKGNGVRVNCLSPGGILDGQPQQFRDRYDTYANVKGMLDPTDVAGVLLFLLSDASQFMTGQNLIVDDGWSL
jgi:NAD(P)-dependent dehydrogenase (short-subunit alcohol dehydrogenase family)